MRRVVTVALPGLIFLACVCLFEWGGCVADRRESCFVDAGDSGGCVMVCMSMRGPEAGRVGSGLEVVCGDGGRAAYSVTDRARNQFFVRSSNARRSIRSSIFDKLRTVKASGQECAASENKNLVSHGSISPGRGPIHQISRDSCPVETIRNA